MWCFGLLVSYTVSLKGPTSYSYYGRPPAMLAAGHSVVQLQFRSSLVVVFFRRPIFDVALPIVTKLCHMFDGESSL